MSEVITSHFFSCSWARLPCLQGQDLPGVMWGGYVASAGQGKATLGARGVGMLGSPSLLLLSLAAGTVPIPWLGCGEASSCPIFWAMEELFPAARSQSAAHGPWPPQPCAGHPSPGSVQGNPAPFLNAQAWG